MTGGMIVTFQDLVSEVSKIGLTVVMDSKRGTASIGSREFANPLLGFKPLEEGYTGSVQVKSINSKLYTPYEISESLRLVDEFLASPLDVREESFNKSRRVFTN